ncbi:MAG TPA: zinc-dependent alcohol dehydrogenase family protein [Chthonomonadales bacterium]|nr:zinc-dependent alcohol dehydrogenase family protein [Chthonomonadales bacterium]
MKSVRLVEPAPIETRPLRIQDVPRPEPGPGQIRIRVEVCGICRTDLHVVEGDLPQHEAHITPGHEVVGLVDALGEGVNDPQVGARVGAAWLHRSCGVCRYCMRGAENLCVQPIFTGYDVPGGYQEYMLADSRFVYALPADIDAERLAPLLCAGIIGYRALMRSNPRRGEPFGIYGFGASAHIVIQIARHWSCPVYVCTRGERRQKLAEEMGAVWVGPADAAPPVKLASSVIFAPAGELVPVALKALDRGGTLALAGIYMSPVPSMNYGECLFEERNLLSVTSNTREDGRALLKLAAEIPIQTRTTAFALEEANEALLALKSDGFEGAGVLQVSSKRP